MNDGVGCIAVHGQRPDFRLDLNNFFDRVRCLHLFSEVLLGSAGRVRLEDLYEPVVSAISMRLPLASSAEKCIKIVRQFLVVQVRSGVEYLSDISEGDVQDFLWMATKRSGFRDPSSSTARNRQWAIKTLFSICTEMGVWDGRDICGDQIEREDGGSSRPFTADELLKVKDHAYVPLWPNGDELLLALSLCGGGPSEVAAACLDDVDFSTSTIRFWGPAERVNPVDPWSLEIFRAVKAKGEGSQPLVVGPELPLSRATQSVTVRLNRLVAHAGFARAKDLTGSSIRLGVARQILDLDGLEAAARFLGKTSLDRTAAALFYRWRETR
jgi:integrase